MSENKELIISKSDIDKYYQQYEIALNNARNDDGFKSDYEVALLLPSVYLKKPSNFESVFDKIIHHLDIAYTKAANEKEKEIISRTVDEIFSDVINIVQTKLNKVIEENEKGLFTKFIDFVSNSINSILENCSFHPADLAITAAQEAAPLIVGFYQYMQVAWAIEKEEGYFYNQLTNIFIKILNSKSFDPEYGLIRNTFSRNKEQILRHVFQEKGLDAAMKLTAFDVNKAEKNESARIIALSILDYTFDYEQLKKFTDFLKENKYSNYSDIINQLLSNYTNYYNSLKDKEKKDWFTPSVFNLYLTDEQGFIEYLANEEKKKKILIGLGVVAVVGLLLAIFLIYKPAAEEEWNRLNEISSQVDTANNELEFKKSIQIVDSQIEWRVNWPIISMFDKENLDKFKVEQYYNTANLMLKNMESLYGTVMNDENYSLLYNKFIQPFENILNNVKKKDKYKYKELVNNFESARGPIDLNRHSYLLGVEEEINKLSSANKKAIALEKIKLLYHNSLATCEKNFGVFKTSYKNFWENKRKKILEGLNK